ADELLCIQARQNAHRKFGANTVNLDQQPEQISIQTGGKTIKALGVFTNGEMGMKGHFLPGLGQMKKRGVGNVNFVTQAGTLHQRLPRRLFNQHSSDSTNQTGSPVAANRRLWLAYAAASDLAPGPGHT